MERVSERAVRVREEWAWEGGEARLWEGGETRAWEGGESVTEAVWLRRERVERVWRRQCDGGVRRENDREWRREAWEGEWVTKSGEVCARVRGVKTLYFWKNPIRNRVSETQFLGGTHRSIIFHVDGHVMWKLSL